MSAMNKEERTACWSNRDKYWSCLDEEKPESECAQFRSKFEQFCPSQWVKHFDRKREYLKFKERMAKDGYVPDFPKKEQV